MKRTLVLAVLAVAIVVVMAGVVTYLVTRPSAFVDLNVTDGFAVGAIRWNVTTGSNQTDLILDFAATTYANETNGAASILSLRLVTDTLYDSYGGDVVVNIYATVVGIFAPNLHPANLRLEANQSGPNGLLQSWAGQQNGTNVSFDPGQSIGFFNGTGSVSATVVGEASRFSYSDRFELNGRPGWNRFVGFRATVTGPFTPAVNVGILLKIIDTAGGVWA